MADLTPERLAELRAKWPAVNLSRAEFRALLAAAARGLQYERHDRCFDTAKAVGIDLLKQRHRLVAALREHEVGLTNMPWTEICALLRDLDAPKEAPCDD